MAMIMMWVNLLSYRRIVVCDGRILDLDIDLESIGYRSFHVTVVQLMSFYLFIWIMRYDYLQSVNPITGRSNRNFKVLTVTVSVYVRFCCLSS